MQTFEFFSSEVFSPSQIGLPIMLVGGLAGRLGLFVEQNKIKTVREKQN